MICFFFIVSVLISCSLGSSIGYLEIKSPQNGTYEVFKIATKNSLQFVSEQIGYYNQKIKLTPGRYLILADCSSKTVIIHPGATKVLQAHQVEFVPPFQPASDDSFSIQCDRYSQTGSKQFITNRYSLNILHGKSEILVGMVPWRIDFEAMEGYSTPKKIQYKLSAVRVETYEGVDQDSSYYVSSVDGALAVVESQAFGRWQYLMPGQYRIEANGTSMEISLAEGEQRSIKPSFLLVSTPSGLALEYSSYITGTPQFVELNQSHWLELNKRYPLLPGRAVLRLNGPASVGQTIELEEGHAVELKTRSVTINSDCSPWEWSCLGNRSVYLFSSNDSASFAEGVTDVPLLFFEKEVWISVQGARSIKYKLEDSEKVVLNMGRVRLIPKYSVSTFQMTDLVRIESSGGGFTGVSLDVQLDQVTSMGLLSGNYLFSEYVTTVGFEGGRQKSVKTFRVPVSDSIDIPFSVMLSEKKLGVYSKKNSFDSKHSRTHQRVSGYYPPLPIVFE